MRNWLWIAGAIGLALYLAQALSVPFYVLAFANALVQGAPALTQWFAPIALGTAVILFVINLISTQAAIRSQYLVMEEVEPGPESRSEQRLVLDYRASPPTKELGIPVSNSPC